MIQKGDIPAKVLLLGEHTVLWGSQALAIPVKIRGGQWDHGENKNQSLKSSFLNFVKWFSEVHGQGAVSDRMHADYNNGFFFNSNIPIGYGMGSSGAFAAGIAKRYFPEWDSLPVAELKKKLGSLEDYFHGKSSGIDPLVSYLNSPVLRTSTDRFHALPNLNVPSGWGVYLLDSGMARSTGKLVDEFKVKMEDPTWKREVERTLNVSVDHAIHFWINGSWEHCIEHLSIISHFQWQFFQFLIPDLVKPIWEKSLESNEQFVKLCGAGGGGYFLVISRENEAKSFGREYLKIR